ncbi:tandem-95 repeat protein, partial [bacterium]|nr:tandem-95 repeat protein [bacterium]
PSNNTANGSLKIKSLSPSYAPYVSVAGVASSTIIPQRVNLAKYQTVTASSVSGNRLASYATDGDAGNDSQWQSQNWAYNNARIDFPFPVEVGSAQVFMGINDTLPLAKLVIQHLVGSTWTTIPVTDISGNTNVERNFVFPSSITATSFRIIVTDPVIRLREFALYPPNGPGGYPLGTDIKLNLALQRPAVASSFVAGSFPIHAVDGRTHDGSSWQTTTAGLNTLDIDMVSSTKIGSVHLYSGSSTVSALGDFALKSWNGTAWADIPGGIVTGNTALDRVVTFTTAPTTTRVRLEFTKAGTTPTVIRELQIFPANTGNAGYALGTGINPSGSYADYEAFSDAFYQITNVAANRDIAVATGGQPALEPAGITVAQAQYQVLLNLSDGTYRLRNRDTGECLSGAQLSKTPGAALTDAPYVAMPHQDWILQPLGRGLHQIVNVWSGLVIDTQGGATAPGTALVQNTASNATSQQWRFNYDTWAPKKGLGHGSLAAQMNAKWFYNWGQTNSVTVSSDTVYHPMQWGSFNWTYGTTPGPIWQYQPTWRKRGDGIHLMGFNEPDRTDQSNITLADCVALWPQLMALDQPLVSPSPGTLNPPAGPSWHQQFYAEAARLGYRVEYNAIHTYPGPSGGSSNNLVSMLQTEFTESGRPAWLTEFSFVDWGGNQSWSEEDNYQCLAEFLWRAEGLATLRKYALFVFTADTNNPQPANPWTRYTPAPRSNSYDTSGNLTAFGKLYSGWDSDATIRTDKTYFIHHKGSRKRLANLLATTPEGESIRIDGQPVSWTLVSTGVANRYYVVSSRDGRRLSSSSGAAPTFAPAGTIGGNVEWSLTASQNGWYYLGHPASNRRLQLAYAANNSPPTSPTYSMVASTTTGDGVDWRFIVPLAEGAAPVLASIPAQTVNESVLLTFTATATDADTATNTLTYSLIGAPSGAAIVSTSGVFTWTPTEAQGPGNFTFTVRVSDGGLTHDRSVTVTVNEANLAPVLATLPPQTVSEGSLLTFTASATDADLPANTLTYSLIGAPVGALIVATTGVFAWTPTEAQGPSSPSFTVRVSDGTLTHDRLVNVTVNEVSTAPVLAVIPAQTVGEGVPLTFTASATDADLPANTLTYSLIGAPVGASIIASTGVFAWTPTEAQGPGSPSFTVRVSDGNLTHDRLVNVTVNEVSTAPVLAVIPAQTVSEGVLLTFTAAATDADLPANTLTYSLINAPVGSSIVASTGVFAWTPTEAQGPGSFTFTVQVSDGNLTDDQPVSVTVTSALPSPEVDTDGDGLSDLLEYAFLTDSGNPNGNPFRVISSTTGTVTFEFPWNRQANNLSWQLRHGHDLSNIAAWPVVAPGTTTITREGDIDRITVAPATAYPDRGFYVLEVTGN